MLKCENLFMRFGSKVAVDDLSIEIPRGTLYGFLGPNGAGKTTSIRLFTTMLRPVSGRIWIDGVDLSEDISYARRRIGVVQQRSSLDKDLSVRENMRMHALIRGLPLKRINQKIEELSKAMALGEYMDKVVERLSGGVKKRVSIVCSIVHDPPLLFLDEPTAGLDTQSRNALWKLIRELKASGTTVFLTTHYIGEAEALCDRVGIINRGRLIAEGTKEELLEPLGRVAVECVSEEGTPRARYFGDRAAAKGYLNGLPQDVNASIRATTLEDVFLELTGRYIS